MRDNCLSAASGVRGVVSALAGGSAVTVTYFYYAPPYSENYDGVGIEPHITVELSEEASKKNIYKLTEEEDVQYKAAVEELKTKIATRSLLGNN